MRREDVWRSLKRLLALAFPDPWKIRLEQAQYVEEERPLIIVEPVGDMTRSRVQPTIPAPPQVVAQTFVINAYPALGADPRVAREEAEQVLALLDAIVTVGWVEGEVSVGGPLRLPVWDYAGVPLTGAARGNSHALAEWEQLAWVETWNGLTLPDPQDDKRFTVPYTLRLSWQADARYVPAPSVERFGGVFVADPPQIPEPTPAPPMPVSPVPIIQGPAGPPGPAGPAGPAGKWVQLTQAEYDALAVKDPETLYVIVG